MKDTLYISHNLFLSEKQRYNLYEGYKIKLVGCSLTGRAGDSFEDHLEIFNEYILIPSIYSNKIEPYKYGYKLYLKNNNKKSIFRYIKKIKEEEPSVKKLLNMRDGGSEWLFFEYGTKENKIKHTVEIQKIENLFDTI